MAIIKFVLAISILSILYKRMIDRETPAKISRKQAIVPVLLGILSVPLSFENQQLIGLILGLSAGVLIIVFEVMVFVKAKKNAAAYCAMATVAGKTTDIEEAQAWKNGR